MASNAWDSAVNDFDKGVWIGKRTIGSSPIGLSTYALQGFNANPLHYVIRVDGNMWHVSGTKGSNCKSSGSDTILRIYRCY